jgi:hypothetical protein
MGSGFYLQDSSFVVKGALFVIVATDYFTKWTEANSQAESSNKTLVKLIKKKIEDNLRRWHEVLSEALWAHRISRHGATKVTPFELVYGCRCGIWSRH